MADDDFKAFREYMNTLNWSPSLQQRMRHDLSDVKLPSDALPNTPAFDPHADLAAIHRAWERYPLNNEEAIEKHWNNFLPVRLGDLSAPLAIDMAFYRFVHSLFADNHIYWTQKPNTLDREGLRMLAIRLDPGFLPAAEDAIDKLVRELIALFPSGAFKRIAPHSITVPFCDVSPYAKYLPSFLSSKTNEYRYKDHRILWITHANLIDCIYEANGTTYQDYNPSKHKLTFCVNAEGPPAKVLRRYLPPESDFLELLTAPIAFEIPAQKFASHGIIVAPPGHGKTQLLSTFIARFISDAETGIVVLDPHGDLFASLKGKVPSDRLIILDPSTDPPPLNVFDFGNAHDVQILQAFSYLMAALTGGMSDKQAAVLPYLLKLIRAIPGATVETLLQIVTERLGKNEQSRFLPYIRTLPALDQDFFINQFIGKMQETKDAIAWKLSAALSYDAFRKMFTAPRNSFDAFRAMQERKIVLVKGSESVLGEYGLPVFLQFIVAQFFLAAVKRDQLPPEKRPLCILFADEASHVFNSQTTRILTECRKYALGFLAATQVIQQIPQDVKAAIYGATAIKIAGPVSQTDAMLLAREMHTGADEIRALKSYERSHAEWMVYVSNMTDHAVEISVPFGAIEKLPELPLHPPPIPDQPAAFHQQMNEFSLRDVDEPIITPPPPPEAIYPGDWVLITINDVQQFKDPVRVRDVQYHEGKPFILVEGVNTGFEPKHCIKVPAPPSEPPPVPGQPPPKPDLGMREPD